MYKDITTKTRVLIFTFDKDDFSDELNNLKDSGKVSSHRSELRIGMVTDKKLIKKYKVKYGTLWFPEGSYNSVVLKRYDSYYFSHDLLEGNPFRHFHYWINKLSLKIVEELNEYTLKIID